MNKKTKKVALIVAWIFIVHIFVLSQMSFWGNGVHAADTTGDAGEIKDSISDLQKQLDKEEAAKKKLEQELGQIQGAVSTTQSVINKTQSAITEVEQTISRKEAEIKNMNEQIDLQKEMLSGLIQEYYYIKNQPILNIILSENDFSDIFSTADSLLTLSDKITAMAQDIAENKTQVEQDKIELADVKQQKEVILDQKVDQKQALVADQVDVQLSIADKQVVIDRLNKELRELQGDISAVSGRSYSIKEIVDAAKSANNETDVPIGFIIGVLKNETALGKNMGQCTYDEVEKEAMKSYTKLLKLSKKWQDSIDTLDRRKSIFEDITDSLGYDSEKEKVSCTPVCKLWISGKKFGCATGAYVGQGGAMGAAQFMSDIWQSYESDITKMTGHKNPDPWNIDDAVMAMALKLRKTPGVTAGKESAMRTAACSYLGTCYASYINGVIYWTKHYKELL